MSRVWLITASAGGLGRNMAEAVLASGVGLVAAARDRGRNDVAEGASRFLDGMAARSRRHERAFGTASRRWGRIFWKAAYDPDGSPDLATLLSKANDDFGQAEPARFVASRLRGKRFARLSLPVLLCSDGNARTDAGRSPHGGEIGFVFGTLGTAGFAPTARLALARIPGKRALT